MEVDNKEHSENLIKIQTFYYLKRKAKPHDRLNTLKEL